MAQKVLAEIFCEPEEATFFCPSYCQGFPVVKILASLLFLCYSLLNFNYIDVQVFERIFKLIFYCLRV